MGRALDLLKPVLPFIPEVPAPGPRDHAAREFNNKLFWTVVCLVIYLVCSQIPLYGMLYKDSDPFSILRTILASSKGTLMELGISPIITSGMILQVLTGAGVIAFNPQVDEDQALFSAASKVLGLLITLGEATLYVLTGNYGPVRELGVLTSLLLIVQLVIGGVIVLTLDDLLSKGYGFDHGINLFIVTNTCEQILWRCFSPTTYNVGNGTQFEGAVIAFFHLLVTRPDKGRALWEALFRENLPNLSNLAATVIVFLLVVFVQGFKYKVPLRHTQQRGEMVHEVKLFYTSNMPIILLSSVTSFVYVVSQILFRRYPTNILVRLLGVWSSEYGNSRPTGGLSYYIYPPHSFTEVVRDPFHALFYTVFLLSISALLAQAWLSVVRQSRPEEIAERYTSANWVYKHGKDAKDLKRHLREVIPTVAALGAMCVAALTIFADLLGAIGSGTGILLSVTIIYELLQSVAREYGGKIPGLNVKQKFI